MLCHVTIDVHLSKSLAATRPKRGGVTYQLHLFENLGLCCCSSCLVEEWIRPSYRFRLIPYAPKISRRDRVDYIPKDLASGLVILVEYVHVCLAFMDPVQAVGQRSNIRYSARQAKSTPTSD